MKLLVDLNLSPRWIPFLTDAGWEATQWSAVGKANASDSEIMAQDCNEGLRRLDERLGFRRPSPGFPPNQAKRDAGARRRPQPNRDWTSSCGRASARASPNWKRELF